MSSVHDPLRFGAPDVEEEFTEEISLEDEPAPRAPTPAPSAPHATPGPAAAFADPLTSPQPLTQLEQPPALHPLEKRSSSSSAAEPSPRDPLSSPSLPTAARPLSHNGSSSLHDSDVVHQADKSYMRNAVAEAAGPSHRPAPLLRITVTDPVKRVSDHPYLPMISTGHFEYLVSSAPQGGGGTRHQVRRRFNDFVALADLLEESHRGYFIFPRPDKGPLEGAAAGRSEGEFVEARRGELERYLARLAAHPVLGGCEELRVFLQAEGSLASAFAWQQLQPLRGSLLQGVARLPRQLLGSDSSVPTTMDAAKNARHTNDLLRRIKETAERVKQEYQAPAVLSEDETRLRETKAGVESYAELLATASRRAERLVREFERVGAATGDLGLSLIRLAKYEDEEGGRCGPYSDVGAAAKGVAADARRAGMAAVRMSRLARSATAESMAALEPLHAELAMAPAVGAALREREAALLTAQSLRDDLDKKRAGLAAAEAAAGGGDANKARRAAALRDEIAAGEAALDAARAEYDRVKERNRSELARWRAERSAELQRMVRGYGQVAALYEERASQVWREVELDLGGDGEGGRTAEAAA